MDVTRRFSTLALGLILFVGCAAADDAVRAGDDVARWVGLTTDEIDLLAQRSAKASNSTSDDLLAQWRQGVSEGRTAYREVPEEARLIACDVASDALEAILTEENDFSVLASGAEALSSLNQTAGSQQLAQDLRAALGDWESGDRGPIKWLLIKSSACGVVP